jgi:hypothetical protein
VALELRPGGRFAGTVVFDAASAAPADLTRIQIALTPLGVPGAPGGRAGGPGESFAIPARTPLGADGTFDLAGLAPGRYRVEAAVPAAAGERWWLRSAIVGGRDLLDEGLEAVPGETLTEAVLTVTDRHTRLFGTLQSAAGLPAPEYFVVVFPTDRALWREDSRRIRSTRPATDGAFGFDDLPAGEYLIAALTDVEPDEWLRAEFLAEIAAAGVKVSLGEGERKRQDLRVATGRGDRSGPIPEELRQRQ